MNRRNLTEAVVRRLTPHSTKKHYVWDLRVPGLCVIVYISGEKVFYYVYSFRGQARFYRIGPATLPIDEVRKRAKVLIARVAEGNDPQAERREQAAADTFEKLHARYVTEHAQRRNKSWRQADSLIKTHVLPRWENRLAKEITRKDVKAIINAIAAPILANQVEAAVSAVFTWGMREDVVVANPCRGIASNPTQSLERILSDEELPVFWHALDEVDSVAAAVLKTILLTGQRPGDVAHMRREHISKSGWWEMPGEPIAAQGWPGTKIKRTHRVWLPAPVTALIASLGDDGKTEGFVFDNGREAIGQAMGSQSRGTDRLCARQSRVGRV